ncbi:Fungal protein of unknown function (DUF2011) domain containing protein [Naviculisporaceae sp. PSN 640]
MFEVPDAKRVRREDLFSDGASTRNSSPDPEEEAQLQAKLRAQLSNLITVDFGAASVAEDEEVVPEAQDQDDLGAEPEFEFRLFSSAAPQKIVLAPAEGTGKIGGDSGGFVEPRPLSYYIRGELSSEQRSQFAAAAVTAADILQGARQRAWGLEVPWRVTKITIGPSSSSRSSQKGGEKQVGGGGGDEAVAGKKKKGKPGKKARIAARTKQKALLELEKQKMTKEEHLKEKKKRLNHLKKLKRRQKEKEKKAAAAAGSAGAEAGGDGNGAVERKADGDDSMSEGED